ncbi:MAG: hypothetical protein KatS3mg076_2980 [Candidatus Binatia bacterium]|nr:MAG: hypothetical protein KatS3mg076_2980 [Candidatus Binatia bacterium]
MTDSSSARGTAAAWKAVALPSLLWWARELLAALLWGVALAHLFVLDVGYTIESRLPAVAVFVRYRLFVLLAVAALIWLAFGGRWFLRSFGYVIAYPLVLLFGSSPRLCFATRPLRLRSPPRSISC